jgi:glycosyltransferase involved in cell wall biosynthesis
LVIGFVTASQGKAPKGWEDFGLAIDRLIDDGFSPLVASAGPPGEQRGLGKSIELGFLPDDRLATFYSALDVLVVPSHQEIAALVIAESMACSTPVVAYADTGCAVWIDHGKDGYLASHGDPVALAEGIRWVTEDRERLLRLRDAAHRRASRDFSLDVEAGRYQALYSELLTG